MVALGISEFTFGFAFLYEQTQRNWPDLRAAPILPSLRQEAIYPIDAHLPLEGTDFYYQFKLSDYLFRPNASYIRDGTYVGPYYRIALHRHDINRQHRRLKMFAQSHPNTYYVAPEVNNIDDFHSAFLKSQMTDHSRLIPVADCDEIADGEQHFITFQEGDDSWRQHSDKKRHEKSIFGRDIEDLYRSAPSSWETVDKNFATKLFDKTVKNIWELIAKEEKQVRQPLMSLLEFDFKNQEHASILATTSQILSVLFGLTLVIVGKPSNEATSYGAKMGMKG